MLRRTPLKRTAIRRKPGKRAANRAKRGEHDLAYLAWIKEQPCLICSRKGIRQESVTDAHHYGPHGFGHKPPDRRAIPLCHVAHHQEGRESIHGRLGKRFAEHHSIDIDAEIARLNAEYDAHHRAAA